MSEKEKKFNKLLEHLKKKVREDKWVKKWKEFGKFLMIAMGFTLWNN